MVPWRCCTLNIAAVALCLQFLLVFEQVALQLKKTLDACESCDFYMDTVAQSNAE
jgi:hypothetical protein